MALHFYDKLATCNSLNPTYLSYILHEQNKAIMLGENSGVLATFGRRNVGIYTVFCP